MKNTTLIDVLEYVKILKTLNTGKKLTHWLLIPYSKIVKEVWDAEGGGREVQEGEDIGTPLADSCWCMAKINKIL